MAINFPTSPTTNDIHSENNLSWKFDGISWVALPTPSVAGNVAYTPAGTGAVVTDVETKLRESVSVKDFGAVGDGVTDDTDAISDMITAMGYALFTSGVYAVKTSTIDAPIHFEAGASITVPTANTLTITDRIESPRQWIFQGAGDYALGHDSDSGEDARMAHASWFGAFPSLDTGVDMSPRIQKAIDAMDNTRESVIDFDIGNYRVGAQITVTRGCWIRGSGSRRTVFSQLTDGFTTFVTDNVAVRFSNLQFENVGMNTAVRSSPYISIQHDDCDIYDIKCGRADTSIEIQANACRVDNIIYVFDVSAGSPSAGSSVIAIRGSDCRVSNILGYTSADIGPDYIVHVGANIGSLGCSNTIIENIYGITPAVPVYLDATNESLNRINVSNVTQNAFTGGSPDATIRVETGGSNSVNGGIIQGVASSSYPTNGIRFIQASSGTMQDIHVDGVTLDAISGNGIEFTQSSGTLREVTIGGNVDVRECGTPYSYTGSTSDIVVNPSALPDVLPAYCYDFSIGDDTAVSVNLNKSVFTGILMVSVGTSNYWVGTLRCASSPAGVGFNVSANMESVTTALSGTTGNDTKFTVGFTDGVLYLENRLGSTQRVSANILTGVS